MRRRIIRYGLYGLGGLAALAVILVAAGLIVVQTPWFRNQVRQRMVYEMEKATGGRVELGAFDFDWHTLTAGVRNLVIHGTEGAGEAPLFRADSIQVGLKIISALKKRVDLESVVVRRPQVNVIVYADGRTNLPKPKVRGKRKTLDAVLDLAIKRFNLVDGSVRAQLREIPLNVRGENLRAQVFYEPRPERYRGAIGFRSLDVQPAGTKPFPIDVDARLTLERDRLNIQAVHLAANGSSLDASGTVDHFASPQADLVYSAHVNVKEMTSGVRLSPLLNQGALALAGRLSWSGASSYALTGTLRGNGLAFREGGIFIGNIRVDSGIAAAPGRIEFRNLTVSALHGRLEGRAEIANLREFRMDGAVRGFALHEMTHVREVRRMVWNGDVSGPVHLAGEVLHGKLAAFHLSAGLGITPAAGEDPVEGVVNLTYDHAAGAFAFSPSNLKTRYSRINFSGVLGRQMNATVETTNLDDAQPAIAMFTEGPPPAMPVKLINGTAKFQGVVAGPVTNPVIQGHATMTNCVWTGRQFDRAEADVTVSRSGVVARNALLARLRTRAAGIMRVRFSNWKADAGEPIDGQFTVHSPDLAGVLTAANVQAPFEATTGDLTANVTLSGTLGAPLVAAHAQAMNVVFLGQPIDRLQGDVRYTGTRLDIPAAQLDSGDSHAHVSGSFEHPQDNWSQGRIRFQVGSRGISLAQLKAARESIAEIQGRLETQLAGEVSVDRTGFRLGAFNGQIDLRNLAVGGEPLGSLALTAATQGPKVDVRLEGKLAGAKVTGASDFSLQGNYPARGHIEFTPLRFSTLLARLRRTPAAGNPPFNGLVAGTIDFSGNTTDSRSWKGSVQLPEFEVQPSTQLAGIRNAPALELRNTGPILLDIDLHGAHIRQAHFRGKDTNFSMTGRIGFDTKSPLDLRAQGNVNLTLLRDFDDQIYSSGSVILDVSVRGALDRPEMYGRVDLRNGSLNLANVSSGIDHANGVIFLYRDRATIDTLTAESGGGKLAVSGFISMAGITTFHLQATAADVRVRYPEGISSTSNAKLTLTGTTDRSVLAGDVTIMRVSFNPRSDLGTILATAAQPVETPAQPSRFRQGLRFDVHLTTSSEARFETKLTKGIEADANLRLRGDGTRPLLLGRVLISQGEVLFFGNKYTINSGQILFVNASKIEPVVNLDLDTRAAGVDVTLHVSGPVNKLNVSYRSDPPLPFSEIVALLTTGRQPATQTAATPQSQIGQNWQQAGATALLSQAIASPLTGRLERFFGVSRLKIDPQVTGLTTSNAAARVTLEQNITPNLVFTYITDLSRAQAQTIRIEWDFTNNLSGVAVREENGLFGIDFLYRKQVK